MLSSSYVKDLLPLAPRAEALASVPVLNYAKKIAGANLISNVRYKDWFTLWSDENVKDENNPDVIPLVKEFKWDISGVALADRMIQILTNLYRQGRHRKDQAQGEVDGSSRRRANSRWRRKAKFMPGVS